jgi:aerobic-type carbon monoxide dehydrogenase small subunit (CoxS/CutS family)
VVNDRCATAPTIGADLVFSLPRPFNRAIPIRSGNAFEPARRAGLGSAPPGAANDLQQKGGRRMALFTLNVNGRDHTIDVPPEMTLLWALRDVLGMTGTKYGCGITVCGACTVHIDGEPSRSCRTTIAGVAGRRITTIEGLSTDGSHPVQQAWIAEDVPQCGYCQVGQVMAAAALLADNAAPSDADIDEAMRGNICRCGTYDRIRRAIHRAAATTQAGAARVAESALPGAAVMEVGTDGSVRAASARTAYGASSTGEEAGS